MPRQSTLPTFGELVASHGVFPPLLRDLQDALKALEAV